MNLRLLKDLSEKDLAGKRVLLRADFDVGISNTKTFDDFRIKKIIPTILYILKAGGLVRIISHTGRPHGKKDQSFSFGPVAIYLEKLLNQPVILVEDPFLAETQTRLDKSNNILLFENIRFW